MAMRRMPRLIIVRRGDTALFSCLKERFPDAVLIYDRRAKERVTTKSKRGADQRAPQGEIVASRGYYASRQRVPRF
jgi:hypothetical protein